MFVLRPAAPASRDARLVMVGSRRKFSALSRLSTTWMISSTKPSRPTKALMPLICSAPASRLCAHRSRSSSVFISKTSFTKASPVSLINLYPHDLQNPLQLLVAEKSDVERAFALLIFQANLRAETLAQPVFEIGHIRILRERRADGSVGRGSPDLKARHQRLGLADVQAVFEDSFRGGFLLPFFREAENHLGMAHRKQPGANRVLDGGNQVQQAERVGHDRAAFAHLGRHFFLRELKLFGEL